MEENDLINKSRLVVFSSVSHFVNHCVIAHAGFVKEIDLWAKIFDRVLIVTIKDPGMPTEDAIPYKASNIDFFWLSGSIYTSGIFGKIRLLTRFPGWIIHSAKVLLADDILMARGPDSIGFLGFILGKLKRLPHFAKYADQWQNFAGEPLGYRLQKMVYRSRFFGGPVQIYGTIDSERPHLVPFFTSSISSADWIEASELMKERPVAPPFRLLFVGRLAKAKGVDVIIQAMDRLNKAGYNVRLDIVGEGPEAKNLASLSQSLGLTNSIQFSGNLGWESLKLKYASSHCFIHASRKEGFGKVIIEAMTFALPIIATDVGVSREILQPPEFGVIVKPNNPEVIATQVMEMIDQYPEYVSIGNSGRVHAKKYLLDNVEVLYKDFIDKYVLATLE